MTKEWNYLVRIKDQGNAVCWQTMMGRENQVEIEICWEVLLEYNQGYS